MATTEVMMNMNVDMVEKVGLEKVMTGCWYMNHRNRTPSSIWGKVGRSYGIGI